MISFYREAIKAIDKGLSPWVKYLVGSFSLLFFLLTLLPSLNGEKPLYEFSFFCALLAALCFTEGKVQCAIGRGVSLIVVILACWYLYLALTYSPVAGNDNSPPSLGKAVLFSCLIGLPALKYLFSGRLVKPNSQSPKKNYKRRKR